MPLRTAIGLVRKVNLVADTPLLGLLNIIIPFGDIRLEARFVVRQILIFADCIYDHIRAKNVSKLNSDYFIV